MFGEWDTTAGQLEAAEREIRQLKIKLEKAMREENEACAKIAENPYGDEVKALGFHQPFRVGAAIARAIRERMEREK